MLRAIRKRIYGFLVLQLFVVLVVGFLSLVFQGTRQGFSTVVGGLAAFFPTVCFVKWFFADRWARSADNLLKVFYLAELMKLLLSAVLVVGSLSYLPISAWPFFLGFVVTLLSNWLTPLVILGQRRLQPS